MGLLDGIKSATTEQEYYDGKGLQEPGPDGFGGYQFTSLQDIINQFYAVYVGKDKIISSANRVDIIFHAKRALAELSFDTLKSCLSQEITVPASLQMVLPRDYVNYTKISWVDSAGIKHLLYPTSKTSNPTTQPLTNIHDEFKLQAIASLSTINNFAVLDRLYEEIEVGMRVTGSNIPTDTFVGDTNNTSTKTTVHLATAGGATLVQSLNTATVQTLTFSNADGSLVKPRKSYHVIEGLTDDGVTLNKHTALTAASISELKVGMIVSSGNLPIGTVVTEVSGTEIFYSNNIISSLFITDDDGEVTFMSPEIKDSSTWSNYKSGTPSENQDDYQDDTYWPMNGNRYGLDPQHAQANGSFYIDCVSGKIHFSSNIAGKTVILDYISDSLGTGEENRILVHKFAEEAMYAWLTHAVLSGRANVPEYQVNRFKKQRFAAVRTAKLRLSNLKLEELTQILRGKSKQIKH